MKHVITIICILLCNGIHAQDLSLYEKHYYNAPELNLPYRYLRPAKLDSQKTVPLIIFLHGAYEKGFDNERQLQIGGRFFLRDSIRNSYPAFVLFPQCPESDAWAYFESTPDATGTPKLVFPFTRKPAEVSSVLMKLLDSLLASDSIDKKRVYICGLSQGGMGVLDLVARYPSHFAAGISICGAGDAATSKKFAGETSLWLFHGDADPIVPVSFSREYFKKLQKLHADVRYSEYPGAQHNSWVNAFREPDLMVWLFSRHKK